MRVSTLPMHSLELKTKKNTKTLYFKHQAAFYKSMQIKIMPDFLYNNEMSWKVGNYSIRQLSSFLKNKNHTFRELTFIETIKYSGMKYHASQRNMPTDSI